MVRYIIPVCKRPIDDDRLGYTIHRRGKYHSPRFSSTEATRDVNEKPWRKLSKDPPFAVRSRLPRKPIGGIHYASMGLRYSTLFCHHLLRLYRYILPLFMNLVRNPHKIHQSVSLSGYQQRGIAVSWPFPRRVSACVCVCVCGHHFQQTGYQPGMVAKSEQPSRLKFGLAN